MNKLVFERSFYPAVQKLVVTKDSGYALVANQSTNNIIVFKRDLKTGLLQKTGEEIKIPKPVCLQMME